jgi:hypothetical protein
MKNCGRDVMMYPRVMSVRCRRKILRKLPCGVRRFSVRILKKTTPSGYSGGRGKIKLRLWLGNVLPVCEGTVMVIRWLSWIKIIKKTM